MPTNDIFKHTNGYAMQHGIVLGLFACMTLAVFKWSLTYPFFSMLFTVMLLGGPVMTVVLTRKFRSQTVGPQEPFSFSCGFMHALFTGFYASVWVALFIFVYLRYFDHGSLFAAYANSLDTPEMKAWMQQSGMDAQINLLTEGQGVKGLVAAMQRVGAATYASLALYGAFLVGPFVAILSGVLNTRRAGRFGL
ncbi:MAG: DUF4199 domain-containing protein [Alloprevotella sp.]